MTTTLPDRRSIRLPHYDYSGEAAYFITICVQDKLCLLGKVIDGEMILNDAGQMVMCIYKELPNKFGDIHCHEIAIMPNHIHFIVENVGVDLCVNPNNTDKETGEHIGSPLHRIIQWFKTMTTNYYIQGVKEKKWQPFNRRLWQRNYYEHIIRDANSFAEITEYISNNPANWISDDYYVNEIIKNY